MAKNDARKNGFEKTNPEDLAAKEEKFRTFFSTSVAQVPDEMKHRDDEKQHPGPHPGPRQGGGRACPRKACHAAGTSADG